jgi:chitinase
MSGSLENAQDSLSNWNNAQCFNSSDNDNIWHDTPISIISGTVISVMPTTVDKTTINTDHPSRLLRRDLSLVKRDTCSYTQAQSGDGCWSLSQTCGITQQQFENYNGDQNVCNTIQVGQYFCCSPGTLPDFSPQPQSDGSCTTYTIKSGDTCATIASAHTMTVDQINNRNGQTWAWAGCTHLLIGQVICLSTGTPPMPASINGTYITYLN